MERVFLLSMFFFVVLFSLPALNLRSYLFKITRTISCLVRFFHMLKKNSVIYRILNIMRNTEHTHSPHRDYKIIITVLEFIAPLDYKPYTFYAHQTYVLHIWCGLSVCASLWLWLTLALSLTLTFFSLYASLTSSMPVIANSTHRQHGRTHPFYHGMDEITRDGKGGGRRSERVKLSVNV